MSPEEQRAEMQEPYWYEEQELEVRVVFFFFSVLDALLARKGELVGVRRVGVRRFGRGMAR